jgi:transposase InsO family protein
MQEDQSVEKKKNNNPKPPRGFARGAGPRQRRYTPQFKLRVVKLYLEEGFTPSLIAQELGLTNNAVYRWTQRYRQSGEQGLIDLRTGPSGVPKLPAPVRDKIVELKNQQPAFGIKRISQLLCRWFFLRASPETVRQTLHEAKLIPPTTPPKKRNLTRPRFFERATPNQLWQSDIFTFRLGGRYAYLIAFLDDYSRYLVGADLFRSPTAAATIEVYRVAVGEYQPPKEMLTDNGRQYTTWRGTSRFEAELKKDRVIHIKSRPQHPMTLGKIERFWETLWQEFLVRAQFDSFEQARERIKLWIKYYNHKRPHQGIEGLCPADRFFEIQSELRRTIEAGIQQNILEMALRGQPRAPFYMVGRMEGQSVVLRAEKGKLKLELSDPQNQQTQELIYDLNQQNSEPRQAAQEDSNPDLNSQRFGQSPGSTGSVDRTLQTSGGLPPAQHQLDHLPTVATPGDGRHAPGTGEPGQLEQGRSLEPAPPATPATPTPQPPPGQTLQPAGAAPTKQDCFCSDAHAKNLLDEVLAERHQRPTTSRTDPQSPLRPTDSQSGCADAGHQPPAILPMGTTSPASAAERAGGSTPRPAEDQNRSGQASAATTASPTPGQGAAL